jgi:hypothetical protein
MVPLGGEITSPPSAQVPGLSNQLLSNFEGNRHSTRLVRVALSLLTLSSSKIVVRI